jgi:DNA-binding Xre family transcriptional regulator
VCRIRPRKSKPAQLKVDGSCRIGRTFADYGAFTLSEKRLFAPFAPLCPLFPSEATGFRKIKQFAQVYSMEFYGVHSVSNTTVSFSIDNCDLFYNRLWKLLIDKKMTRGELRQKTGLSPSVISKMSKGHDVNTDSLLRTCDALGCQ